MFVLPGVLYVVRHENIYYQVDAHCLWQMQPDCIIYCKLCNIIWSKPLFHSFLEAHVTFRLSVESQILSPI